MNEDDLYIPSPEATYCVSRIKRLIGDRIKATEDEQRLIRHYNIDLLKAKLGNMNKTERDRATRTIANLSR